MSEVGETPMRPNDIRTSEIIQVLQGALEKYGDLPVVLYQVKRRLRRRQTLFHIVLSLEADGVTPTEIVLQDEPAAPH